MSAMFEEIGHQFSFKSSYSERAHERKTSKVLLLFEIICEFWNFEEAYVDAHKREAANLLLLPEGLLISS
jgi:hypothetical protein